MVELVDVLIENDNWHEHDFENLAEEYCAATLAYFGYRPKNFEISVLACGDDKIAELNTHFRDKPVPTNVLSWPSVERASKVPGQSPTPLENTETENALGDIAIAFETCWQEASKAGKPFHQHIGHLMVHATLHLLGYDHISAQDALLMENIERQVLATLGQPDPYGGD